MKKPEYELFKIPTMRNKKAYAKAEMLINAPVEEVFQKVADIEQWPQWQLAVKSARISGPLKRGTTFRWQANGMIIKSKLHTMVPSSAIGWTGKVWWIKAVHNWSFSSENGKCRVVVEESMSGFMAGFLKTTIQLGVQQNLRELQTAVESK